MFFMVEEEMLLNTFEFGDETIVLLKTSDRPAFTAEGWENPA